LYMPTFGPWTMLLFSCIASMSSKLNNPMQLRKSKMLNVGCNLLWPPHDKIYMSMNHDENIDTFKTCGTQNMKQNFNQLLFEMHGQVIFAIWYVIISILSYFII
jgi:hypothetical protein